MTQVVYQWDGDAMKPLQRFRKHCDIEFVVGQTYELSAHEDRSQASHDQYFASLNDKWGTLPENLQDEYPTCEMLRKKALIRTGYATHSDFVCASRHEALRLTAWLQSDDIYCIVDISDRVIRKYTAKSQSYRAMGKRDFQKSKQDVLDYVDRLLGVLPPISLDQPNQRRATK